MLDGLMHHGTSLRIDTHYVDTGGVSDHVFILCAMLGFRFCPRLRDFPDRKLASIEPPGDATRILGPSCGRRIKADIIREHWDEIVRLVASLKAGTVRPVGHAEEARRLPTAEPARPGPTGARPYRAHTVHAGLAGKSPELRSAATPG